MRRQGENTKRLYLFIKNEAELTGLKAQDEDSKPLCGCNRFPSLLFLPL